MSDNILQGKITNVSNINVGLGSNKTNINVQIASTGPKGDKGEMGEPGVDSYQLWLSQGNTGTLDDFFKSLNYEVSADYVVETTSRKFLTNEELRKLSGYTHTQIASSKTWVIRHNLNKNPSVTIVDTANSVVVGEVEFVDSNQIIVTFSSEFSGKAFLN